MSTEGLGNIAKSPDSPSTLFERQCWSAMFAVRMECQIPTAHYLHTVTPLSNCRIRSPSHCGHLTFCVDVVNFDGGHATRATSSSLANPVKSLRQCCERLWYSTNVLESAVLYSSTAARLHSRQLASPTVFLVCRTWHGIHFGR